MVTPTFQIKKQKEAQNMGRFVIGPLQRGYGQTLGNALRRVLLSSLPGAAVTQIRINGIKHKFSTLEGMREDIIELILNIKQIRLVYQGKKPVKMTLEKSGPAEIKAADIKAPAQVKIINPDLVLANLASRKNKLKIQLTVETGFGYWPAEARRTEKIGVILVDGMFSPVQRVNYWVEATRVGRETDWDKLVLEVVTDGTIKPREALKQASSILVSFFSQVVNPKKASVAKKSAVVITTEAMNLTVEELELPTRIVNALRRGGYGTASDLAAASRKDLSKVKNLGEKSIKIAQKALEKKGLDFKGEK